ncbi:MAG: DUF3782 domain-containing protein, partial [Methylococcales bacterium]
MTTHEIRQRIKEELTNLIRNDEQTWSIVLDLAREHFADRKQTEDRFDVMMQELRDDRAAQMRKWEENNRRWEEDSRRWDENNRRLEEDSRRWDENSRRWEEDSRRWEEDSGRWDENSRRWDENNRRLEENNRRWDENNRRWDENKNNFDRMHEEIMAIAKKQHDNMSAIGARWGIYAEESFRNGLAAILEKSFGVEVLNVTEYDDQGEVFGRPDQIELDVIMRNG